MRLWSGSALILALLGLGLVVPATADPVFVQFGGVIDSVNDPGGELPSGVTLGASFHGTYTIDPALFPSSIELMPGFFQHTPGPGLVDLDVGGSLFAKPVDRVLIGNDWGGIDFWSLPATPFATTLEFAVVFTDSTATRNSDGSFFVNESLTGWDTAVLTIFVPDPAEPTGTGIREVANGVITMIPVVAALPSSSRASQFTLLAFLLATGLMTLWVVQRRYNLPA